MYANLLPTGGDYMIGQSVTCARTECSRAFIKTTHNQKYCSNECCRIETNRKIMEKYHERAAIKRGKKRTCVFCQTPLSRYNENNFCGSCEVARREQYVGEASELVASVSWL